MQISADDLHRRITEDPDIQVIDVRKRTEWQDGYVPGAALKPLNEFTNLLGDLDRDRPVAAYCKGGYRSSIATSLLHRAQFRQVVNMTGGFDAWKTCQLPVAVPRADG
jgi:hydroxyacylglutathione hydrolase